jgi:spermidine/putrescine-binding protein
MNLRAALLPARRTLPTLLCALALGGCAKIKEALPAMAPTQEIRVLMWSGYVSDDILAQFTRQTGIAVKIDYIDSNEQLYYILTGRDPAHRGPYDLAMPSAFLGERLRDEGQILPFLRNRDDHRFTNLTNLDIPETFDKPGAAPRAVNFDRSWDLKSDPNNDFIAPYIWGATGIAYNAERVSHLPMSWASFFTRDPNRRLRLAMVNDGRSVLGSALIYELSLEIAQSQKNAGLTGPELSHLLAQEFANATAAQIERAGELVKALRPEMVCITSDHIPELLATGQVDMAIAWSGDVAVAMLRGQVGQPEGGLRRVAPNLNIRISLPDEGAIVFRDCFVIPRQCRHQEAAEKFINFLFDPTVAAEVTNYCCYATTVVGAAANVDPTIANSAAYFEEPSPDKNLMPEVGLTTAREQIFTRVWADVLKSFPAGVFQYPPVRPPDLPATAPPTISLPP